MPTHQLLVPLFSVLSILLLKQSGRKSAAFISMKNYPSVWQVKASVNADAVHNANIVHYLCHIFFKVSSSGSQLCPTALSNEHPFIITAFIFQMCSVELILKFYPIFSIQLIVSIEHEHHFNCSSKRKHVLHICQATSPCITLVDGYLVSPIQVPLTQKY